VTGSRAEYGLLYWLIKEVGEDSNLGLQLIVTGMHLSPEFGLTYQQIQSDGFKICKKIEILMSSDTPVGISKSMGLAQISFAEAYEELKPDIIVVLGDRFEIFAAAAAAMVSRLPIAHISGGETTEGAFDEAIRHSVTKMSHIHFASAETYRNRIIQLGELPDYVFNFGDIGIDNIKRYILLNKDELEKSLGAKFKKHNLLITFHPVTLEKNTSKKQFKVILDCLDNVEDTLLIFTKANADTDGRIINQMIDEYVLKKSNAVCFTSLGQIRYLSCLKYIDGTVGNSSSGIVEAPSFKIGTINIGDRQKGRIKAKSVIDCDPTKESITDAMKLLYSPKFQKNLSHTINPFENHNTIINIINVLKTIKLDRIIKKKFYDIG